MFKCLLILIELVILFFLASLQLTLSSVRLLPYTVKKKKTTTANWALLLIP